MFQTTIATTKEKIRWRRYIHTALLFWMRAARAPFTAALCPPADLPIFPLAEETLNSVIRTKNMLKRTREKEKKKKSPITCERFGAVCMAWRLGSIATLVSLIDLRASTRHGCNQSRFDRCLRFRVFRIEARAREVGAPRCEVGAAVVSAK